MPDKIAKPFPLTLEVEFLDRLSEPVREGRAKSVSEIIRTALENYDLANVVVMHPLQVQISVRLPVEIRRSLKKISRSKHTSIGQLVRAAVEAYLPQLEAAAPAAEKPVVKAKRKTGKKRALKK
jgi:predicted DNA-binding protein